MKKTSFLLLPTLPPTHTPSDHWVSSVPGCTFMDYLLTCWGRQTGIIFLLEIYTDFIQRDDTKILASIWKFSWAWTQWTSSLLWITGHAARNKGEWNDILCFREPDLTCLDHFPSMSPLSKRKISSISTTDWVSQTKWLQMKSTWIWLSPIDPNGTFPSLLGVIGHSLPEVKDIEKRKSLKGSCMTIESTYIYSVEYWNKPLSSDATFLAWRICKNSQEQKHCI